MHFSFLLATAACAMGMAAALESIITKGRHFYTSETNSPFFIRGVDYQPGGSASFKKGSDPLSDINTCARDIYLFQQLGINVIRVYSVDPDINHDDCMTLMAMAGIYLILDVNTPLPNQHLNNKEPWTSYNEKYLEHIFKVVDVFSGYHNTLGYLAGNEVIFDKTSAKMSPNYQKAVVRDLKGYMTNHVARIIPVGYSNADDLDFRISVAIYLQCGLVGYVDFFGVNSYQWCGQNTFVGSGYDILVKDYSDYTLAILFTEFGCNKVTPRKWPEIDALYSTQMTGVFSGGLAYELTQESNKYGLADVGDDGSVSTLPDYDYLKTAYAKVPSDKITIPSDISSNSTRPLTCPDSSDPVFEHITANHTLPTNIAPDLIEKGVNVTRGKWSKNLKTTMTTFKIKVNGKAVSNPKVEAKYPIDNPPLPAGGHGINVGGGNGKGGPQSGGEGTNGKKAAAATVYGNRTLVFAASLCAVAFGFGLFL